MNEETSQEHTAYEEYVENGSGLLCKINRDFLASPRMLVRGVYKGQRLELTVQRRTEGRLVSWIMKDHDTYVINVKAKMLYTWDRGT